MPVIRALRLEISSKVVRAATAALCQERMSPIEQQLGPMDHREFLFFDKKF